MQGYRSTVDAPMCDLIPELIAAYANAKFILSLRDTQEVWWRSWSRYAKFFCFADSWYYKIYHALVLPVMFVKTMNNLIVQTNIRLLKDYGSWTPEIYRVRNQRIRDTVPPQQLLEYNCKQGWEPLCKFLNVPVPDQPFPKVNEGNSLMGFIVGSQVYGAVLWGMWFGAAAAAIYVANDPSGALEIVRSSTQRLVDAVKSLVNSRR